jgi:single-stranded DNA-binding protein
VFIGNLYKDIELRYSEKGNAYGRIKLRVPRSYKPKGEEQTKVDWLQFTIFGKPAETLAQLSEDGDVLEIHARAESFKRDRPDGTKEYGIQLIAERTWNHTRGQAKPEGDKE